MYLSSEAKPGRSFTLRYKLRLFRCHGCGTRMARNRSGVLSMIEERGTIQWACVGCYLGAFRRAAT